MASPQVENGHTRICNELFEHIIMHPFSARELKVIMAVIRKTYGFNKKTDRISLSQLSKMTGIRARNHVAEVVAGLVSKNVIIRERTSSTSRLTLQKDYELWGNRCSPPREHPPTGAPAHGTKSVPSHGSRSVTASGNNKRQKDKKTHTRESQVPYQAIVDLYNHTLGEAGLPRVAKLTDTRRKHLKARWNESPNTSELDWWERFFSQVAKTDFLMGNGRNGWRADFDWLMKQGNFLKVIEGRY